MLADRFNQIDLDKKADLERSESECEAKCGRLLTKERHTVFCYECSEPNPKSLEWAVLRGQRIVLPEGQGVPEESDYDSDDEESISRRHRCLCGSQCVSCVRIDNLITSPSALQFPVVLFITGSTACHDDARKLTPELYWFFSVQQLNAFLASRTKVIDNRRLYQGYKQKSIPHRWTSADDLNSNLRAVTMLRESMLDGSKVGHDHSVYFAAVLQNARFVDQPAEHEAQARREAQQSFDVLIATRR